MDICFEKRLDFPLRMEIIVKFIYYTNIFNIV